MIIGKRRSIFLVIRRDQVAFRTKWFAVNLVKGRSFVRIGWRLWG